MRRLLLLKAADIEQEMVFGRKKKKDLHQDTNASLSKVQAYPLSHGAVQALPDFK